MTKRKKIETVEEAIRYLSNHRIKVEGKTIHASGQIGIKTWGVIDLLKRHGYLTVTK